MNTTVAQINVEPDETTSKNVTPKLCQLFLLCELQDTNDGVKVTSGLLHYAKIKLTSG